MPVPREIREQPGEFGSPAVSLASETQRTAAYQGLPPDAVPEFHAPGIEVIRELGKGGMGVVFEARQAALNRTVAIKVIRASATGDTVPEGAVARFRQEAEAVAQLQHPNIVQIFEVGESAGGLYLILEFVPGGSLDGDLRKGPLSFTHAAVIVERLARGIQHAHDRGIVHRDLKPANVLLLRSGPGENATPKITDFGLAKLADSNDAALTQPGVVMGTPSYMPPEQAAGLAVGPPADVYSLGAILYACLTGQAPFTGSVAEVLRQVQTGEPVSPRQLRPETPRDLEAVCLHAMDHDPARRYRSAGELADDLQRFLESRPTAARPLGPLGRLAKWARRRPDLAAVSTAAVLLVLAAFATVLWQLDVAVRAKGDLSVALGKEKDARETADAAVASLSISEGEKSKALVDKTAALAKAESAGNDQRETYYTSLIQSAEKIGAAGDWGEAERLLALCPPELRGWEWDHLASCYRRTLVNHGAGRPQKTVFSPDGSILVSFFGEARAWDALTGKLLWSRPNAWSFWAAFRANGELAISEGDPNTALVSIDFVNPATGQSLRRLPIPADEKQAIHPAPFSFTADGSIIGVGVDATVRVVEAKTGGQRGIGNAGNLLIAPGGNDFHTPFVMAKGAKRFPDWTEMWTSHLIGGNSVVVGVSNLTAPLDSKERRSIKLIDVVAEKQRFTAPFGAPSVITLMNASRWRSEPGRLGAISQDGRRLAIWISDEEQKTALVRVYDLSTGTVLRSFFGNGPFGTLAISADARHVAAWSGYQDADGWTQAVRVFDVEANRELRNVPLFTAQAIAFATNRSSLAIARNDEVQIWDIEPPTLKSVLRSEVRSPVRSLVFSPDDSRLAANTDDGHTLVWDVRPQATLVTARFGRGQVLFGGFSPDNRRFFSNAELAIDRTSPELTGSPPFPNAIAGSWDEKRTRVIVEATPMGTTPFQNTTERIQVVESETRRILFERAVKRLDRTGPHLSPDGGHLATSSFREGAFGLYEIGTVTVRDLAMKTEIVIPEPLARYRLGRDGHFLIGVGQSGNSSVWDLSSGQAIKVHEHRAGVGVEACAISSDARFVAFGSANGLIRIVKLQAPFDSRELMLSSHRITSLGFRRDASRLVAGDYAGNVKIWDPITRRELLAIPGHAMAVRGVGFSPDGRTLATTCEDGLVRFYRSDPIIVRTQPPRDAEAWLQRAKEHAVNGRWKDALSDSKQAAKLNPRHSGVQKLIGEAATRTRRWEDALSAVEQMVRDDPDPRRFDTAAALLAAWLNNAPADAFEAAPIVGGFWLLLGHPAEYVKLGSV